MTSAEQALRATIDAAIAISEQIKKGNPSRFASLAHTSLEQARHWAEDDLAQKTESRGLLTTE